MTLIKKSYKKENIAIFGTSANPPTYLGGHFSLLEWLSLNFIEKSLNIKTTKNFSEIWVMPVFQHSYKKKANIISFEDRVKMCFLTFKGLKHVYVKEYEKYLFNSFQEKVNKTDSKIGTIDLLNYLKKKHPTYSFTLILGEDTYSDLLNGFWKDSKKIIRSTSVCAIKRPGYSILNDNKTIINVNTLSNTSSSQVRIDLFKAVKEKKIHEDVYEFIKDNKLYIS